MQSGRNEEFKEMLTGSPAWPRPKSPLAFHKQFFSFSRLSESLEQAKLVRASHRYREVVRSNPVEVLKIVRLLDGNELALITARQHGSI